MITTAPETIAWPTVQGGTFKANRTPIPHDMSCAHCNHGLHVHLACGEGCQCGPQAMPGTAA